MIRDDDHWLTLTDAFHSAAIDGKGWYAALEGLAHATGSQTGELIGIGMDAAVPLNIMTGIDPGFHQAFIDIGGGDPRINPRVKAGMEAPVLKVMAESDFITPDEHKRHPHYREFARPWDVPFICLATLQRQHGMLIGLAVIRTRKQGHINRTQRRAFASVAPHVRAAVRAHIALEGHGDAILSGAMEALSIPAFICDRAGIVRKLTPAAHALVVRGRGLQLKLGRLSATQPADAQALSDAIDAAAIERGTAAAPFERTIVVRTAEPEAAPLVVDIIPLPHHQFQFNFAPRVLVLIRGAAVGAADKRRAAILQAVYGMTTAETQIALQLFAGNTPDAIAVSRDVSVGTVRAQIKALLAKAGANRQIELVARLGRL
ncbi:MAG: helix-turn-helix transcriptional regulator [Steroidobacter sp.]